MYFHQEVLQQHLSSLISAQTHYSDILVHASSIRGTTVTPEYVHHYEAHYIHTYTHVSSLGGIIVAHDYMYYH